VAENATSDGSEELERARDVVRVRLRMMGWAQDSIDVLPLPDHASVNAWMKYCRTQTDAATPLMMSFKT
jgi:hypothetical protein